MNVDKNGNIIDYYDLEDLKNMDKETFKQNFPQILKQILNSILHPDERQSKRSIHSHNDCVGTYFVSGYTRADGTEVKSYTRHCGAKHSGMSQEERIAGQNKYKGKKFQDIPQNELETAISYFL